MVLTIRKKGTLVIPQMIRDQWHLVEGAKFVVSVEDRAIVLLPFLNTRMDENFDEARFILSAKGVTLEMALEKLKQIKSRSEQNEGRTEAKTLII